ncbi:asparagine--tRNA ligase [Candidatus Micrarchaeota archaeon]|nr:asparagine--tRNA ligase [Candidatus Micrarchaeota archaeon]
MEFQPIASLLHESQHEKKVRVRGWVHRKRSSGGVAFIVIRDASGIIQVAVKKDRVSDESMRAAEEALMEAHVETEGIVQKDRRAPGGFEMRALDFRIRHSAKPFPISRDKSTEFLLDIRHLWIRSQQQTHVMKVKAQMLESIRLLFKKKGYFETTPPIIVSGACEGGSTLFTFDYFGKKAFLSQSAQLYLEALIYSLEKVYAITPSFRAEKSRTVRHLAEYWHVEGEEAYMDLDGLLKFEEELVTFVCHDLAKKSSEELRALGRDPAELLKVKTPFKRLRYNDAVELLREKGSHIKEGHDLGAEEERLLTEKEAQPIFVTHFPKKIKAFYMSEDPEDSKTVLCNDCLAPEGYGEIIGGSQREDDVKKLEARLRTEGQNPNNYEWYLDLRRYGSVPHSGFGLGAERLLRWIAKLEHIRDTVPFPRVINRSYP